MAQRTNIPAGIVSSLEESLRWSRDFKGEKYRHAIPCEWCFQQGLLHAIVNIKDDGTTVGELRKFYTAKVGKEKKRVVKKATKKRVVVRRKK